MNMHPSFKLVTYMPYTMVSTFTENTVEKRQGLCVLNQKCLDSKLFGALQKLRE